MCACASEACDTHTPMQGTLPENLNHLPNPRGQRVKLFSRVVNGQGGASCCGQAVTVHNRLSAVVAGADRDTLVIQQGSYVVRVRTLHYKAYDGRLMACGSHQADPFDLREQI